MLRDERFEVVCSGGELRKAALKDLYIKNWFNDGV